MDKIANEIAKLIEETGMVEGRIRCEIIADELVANGVTIQRWIPVSERLPEQVGVYLVFTKAGNQSVQWFHMLDRKWPVETYEDTLRYFGDVSQHKKVTHWMPLPLPPKEET